MFSDEKYLQYLAEAVKKSTPALTPAQHKKVAAYHYTAFMTLETDSTEYFQLRDFHWKAYNFHKEKLGVVGVCR